MAVPRPPSAVLFSSYCEILCTSLEKAEYSSRFAEKKSVVTVDLGLVCNGITAVDPKLNFPFGFLQSVLTPEQFEVFRCGKPCVSFFPETSGVIYRSKSD